MRSIHLLLVFLFICSSSIAQKNVLGNNERLHIATQLETSMNKELLDIYYPQNMDSLYGGFLSTYTYDFKLTGSQDKFIVTQARHIWTTAKAAELYPKKKYYIKLSQHGYHFLRDKMWDKTYGGFYNMTNRQGKDISNARSPKEAYGHSFAMYALAAYYKASKDTGALGLAKRTFRWLEQHSHDAVHKGYYQHLQHDGTPIFRTAALPMNVTTGYKDQNSSIHLLEALTELYGVWPDKLVKERLAEMLYLVRDTMAGRKDYLTLYFKPDWTPVSLRDSSEAIINHYKSLDHISFGHDVETAYLMLEALHALGLKDDTATIATGKRMVDHALRNGWDRILGGFYDAGYYFKNKPGITILLEGKNWWTQAEGMNTLLLLADRFPNDQMRYFEKFKQLWQYTQTYLIDHEHGDWYEEGLDKDPKWETTNKAHIWKATYHNFRALANCVKRLRHAGDE